MDTATLEPVEHLERFMTCLSCSRCGAVIPDGQNHGSERRPACGPCWQAETDAEWEEWWLRTAAGSAERRA